jgi:hypothetical protein
MRTVSDAPLNLIPILSPPNLACSLKELIIEFTFAMRELYHDPTLNWTDLKNLLLRFERLEVIYITSYLAMGESTISGLKDALEPFESRGILQVENPNLPW